MRVFHKSLNGAVTGSRATVKKTPPLHVGRGPVPRHAAISGETRSPARMASEHPALRKKTPPRTVGRGPVPRHAAIAGETRSPARVASEHPALRKKTPPRTVGRGPVPRHATIAGETRSDARVASEGPRATGKNGPVRAQASPNYSGESGTGAYTSNRLLNTSAFPKISLLSKCWNSNRRGNC